MRIHIATLGCRLNQSESDRIARDFAALGHELVSDPRLADLHVVNTCAVTHKATRESRQIARAEQRAAPGALTVVTGCASQLDAEYFAAIGGSSLITGHADKERLIPLLVERGLLPPPDPTASESFPLPHTRTRAFVKIQDGCGNQCAYCVSRLARGAERSRPIAAIVHEVRQLVAAGFQEVVLTGLHAAAYGHDLQTGLTALVRALLAETSVPRIRLSSLEPWGASDELLDLWQDARLCRHLHLPLQSGCDRTLRRMRRGYNTRQYAVRIESARKRVPGIAISTDLIAGFPGETEADFAESAAFAARMAFAQSHVFPFSARAGTEAALMPAQVEQRVKHDRAEYLSKTGRDAQRLFREALVGQTLPVLWEECVNGMWSGLTDNYVRVFCAADADLHNCITQTRLTALHDEGLRAAVPAAPARQFVSAHGGYHEHQRAA